MIDSRNKILETIRQARHEDCPLPDVPIFEPAGDPIENFIANLESFDGKAIKFASRQEAVEWLNNNIVKDGKNVFSAIADFEGNFPLSNVEDPHDAHVIDTCVGDGLLGVGETGSV